MKSESVTVKVPASTSNLGSGFDTLGLALKLYNQVTLARRRGKGVNLASPVAESEWARLTAMVYETWRLFFDHTKKPTIAVDVELDGDIAPARGLGASATLRVGILAGLDHLAGTKLPRHVILELATQLEHHPDNAAPAVFGGFTVAGMLDDSVTCQMYPVAPKARFVVLVPRFEISTDAARSILPHTYNKGDTLHALNRAALISAAFATQNYEALRGLFDDRVHQPAREQLIPQLPNVIRAGERAGAIGGWLSGAGSGIVCLTLEKTDAVARAMQKQLPESDVKILSADLKGYVVV